MKRWYDGYLPGNCQIYNPRAVVSVMLRGEFQSYWSQTGTYDVVVPLINMNFDGLKTAIIEMLSGTPTEVDVRSFQNDMVKKCKHCHLADQRKTLPGRTCRL